MIARKCNSIMVIGLFLSFCTQAQQFRHRCPLDTVKETGFYSIVISPELSAYIKTDLNDVRIADEKKQWVPHIINYPAQNKPADSVYTMLPVIKKESNNSKTALVVRNPLHITLSDLYLTLKNTAASRFAALSGSDDNKKWFTIADSLLLKQPFYFPDQKVALNISFPPVSYAYFRITIDNGKKDPLNLLEVLNYGPVLQDSVQHFIENPPASFQQTDSTGFSLIRVINRNNFHFSKLNIQVSSPKYFERRTRLYRSPVSSILSALQATPINDFLISSGNYKGYDVSLMKDSVFYLLVENDDNPPVRVEAISTQQESKEIIAYLEKGKNYQLLFDDLNAIAGTYDLKHFKDLIPKSSQRLKTGIVTAISNPTIIQARKNMDWWIWPTVLGVIILLSYLTWSLTRDMKKPG
jgi:hypothetical protein